MEQVILPNGLRIVHQQNDSPVMYCGVMVDCGTRQESDPSLYGMAHFVEHILFKGTRTRDSWHINNRMESVGGELNAFTTKEDTTYYAVGLNKDFGRACELLCDLVCHPMAPQHELEKEREVVVDEIMSYRDSPAELIFDEMENRLWTADPQRVSLCHNILGTEETVRTFDHDRCMQFIGQHYTPGRMLFFHYGQTPFDRVVKAVERWFDLQPEAESPLRPTATMAESVTPVVHADNTPQLIRLEQGTHQAHVLVAGLTPGIGHDDAAALSLLNNMLGGPGMNSRLGLELREKRGLVYTVESSLCHYTDTGYMGIYFGCDHSDVKRCLALVNRQLERMRTELMTPQQLLRAQKQLCGQLGVSRANLETCALSLAKNMMRLGRMNSLEETHAKIFAVTPEDIHRVANRVFNPEWLKTVVIA